MGPSTIEVDPDVRLQNPTQLSFVAYVYGVEALPTHGSREAFADGIQVGRARWDGHDFDARPLGHGVKSSSELVIIVSDLASVRHRSAWSPGVAGPPSVGRAAGHIEPRILS